MELKIYAVYKGESLIAEGTAQECADQLGIKKKTVWFYARPANHKRYKGTNGRVAFTLDDEDDDF